MQLDKDLPAGKIGNAIYDTISKKNIIEIIYFPMELKISNYMGTEANKYPPGKYEFKVYIEDKLIAVLPFEVNR